MSAELLRQKELEGTARTPLLPEAALRPLDSAEELQRRGAMLVLRHSTTPLLALPPQGAPGPPTPPREPTRRALRKGATSPASTRPVEYKEKPDIRFWAQDGSEDEPPKDSDGEDPEMAVAGGQGQTPGQAPSEGCEGKGLLSGSVLPPPLPLGLPYTVSPYFHTGWSPTQVGEASPLGCPMGKGASPGNTPPTSQVPWGAFSWSGRRPQPRRM